MWKEEELGGFILNLFPNWKKRKRSISAINNIVECLTYVSRERMVAMLII
jgi:hypothetical protein